MENLSSNLYGDYSNWLGTQSVISYLSDCAQQNGVDTESIFDTYFPMVEELGTTYDFMNGKDPNNEEDYNAQTLLLAQGEIEAKDLDDDNLLSLDEYALADMTDTAIAINMANKRGYKTQDDDITLAGYEAFIQGAAIDGYMGNNDSYISADELQEYYKNLEGYTGESDGSQVFDGKFDILKGMEYTSYINDQMKDNVLSDDSKSSIYSVVDKMKQYYFSDDNLTENKDDSDNSTGAQPTALTSYEKSQELDMNSYNGSSIAALSNSIAELADEESLFDVKTGQMTDDSKTTIENLNIDGYQSYKDWNKDYIEKKNGTQGDHFYEYLKDISQKISNNGGKARLTK